MTIVTDPPLWARGIPPLVADPVFSRHFVDLPLLLLSACRSLLYSLGNSSTFVYSLIQSEISWKSIQKHANEFLSNPKF